MPSVERAYQSVKDIEFVITFGSWIRAVHRIAAHGMVVAVFLHLMRVFLTGAYKNGAGRGQHREWNWVLGVGMLLLTLFLSFTGYLLPWDQLAFWAVTVGTNIASSIPWIGPTVRELLIGGRTIEQATLRGFAYLASVQRSDGSWLPLWFGNQHARDDENPTYGTARVLAAYRDLERMEDESARRGVAWLLQAQNPDGGWGGSIGVESSIEETALAVEVLLEAGP